VTPVRSGLLLQLGGFILFGDDAVIGSPMSLLTDDSDKSDSDSKVLNVPASSASKNENQEIIPPGYEGYRKDRHDGYGGVLVAVKSCYISSTVNIHSELVAVV
jgi:hypothetical protein